MCTYFFTCGQTHRHEIGGGKIWDKNSVLQVNAKNEDSARAKVFSLFGAKWCMCYGPDSVSMEHYPNGVCAVINA